MTKIGDLITERSKRWDVEPSELQELIQEVDDEVDEATTAAFSDGQDDGPITIERDETLIRAAEELLEVLKDLDVEHNGGRGLTGPDVTRLRLAIEALQEEIDS